MAPVEKENSPRKDTGGGHRGKDSVLSVGHDKFGVFLGHPAKGAGREGMSGRERVSRPGVQVRDVDKITRDSV